MEFKPTTLKEALKAKGVSMIVYGNPGVGKTSLIKTLVGGVWNEKDMKWQYTGKKYCEPEDILLITVDAGESVLNDPALHNMALITLYEEAESLAKFKGMVQHLRETCHWKFVFIDNLSELEKFFLMSLTKIKELDVPRQKEWGDSVLGDTSIWIKRRGNTQLLPIEDIYTATSGIKRQYFKNTYIWTDKGWSKVKYVYRHKVDKRIYSVLANKGFVETTEDHSFIVEDTEVRPSELSKIEYGGYPVSKVMDIKLDYAWFIGFFVAEGSACESSNYYIGIPNTNYEYLKRCENVLNGMGIEIVWENKRHTKVKRIVVQGERKELCKLFRKWFYTNSGYKKIPDFIYNASLEAKRAFIDGFSAGDGHIDERGRFELTNKSKCVVAGLCRILDDIEVSYSVGYRCSNKSFKIREVKKKKHFNCKGNNTVKMRRIDKYKGYVYDVETENHHFCGGIGNVLLHNSAFYMRKYIRDLRDITKHGTNIILIFWAMSVKDTDKDGVVEHTIMPMVMEKTSKEFVGLVEHTAYMGISEKSGKRYLQFDSNKLVFCKKRNDNLKQFEEANLGDIFRLLKGGENG